MENIICDYRRRSGYLSQMRLILAVFGIIVLILAYSLQARGTEGEPYPDTAVDIINDSATATSTMVASDGSVLPTGEQTAPDEDLTVSATSDDLYVALDPNSGALSGNLGTGADSDNTAVNNTDNQTTVTNQNTATTTNRSYLIADTGNNKAIANTGSGVIVTNDANGQGEIVNVINRNAVQLADTYLPAASAINDTTGVGSDNLAETNINNQLVVKNINESNTINLLEATVNSGKNIASMNTEHGMVLTGDANLGFNFVTMANTNLVGSQRFYAGWQNIFNSYTGNIDLQNEAAADLSPLSDLLIEASNNSTGVDSNNQAIVNINDETTIINQNSGKINNEINAEVNSGQNKANSNTGTGSVASGNVNAALNVVNFLNSNINSSNFWLRSLNVFGDWTGNILMPNMPNPHLNQSLMSDIEAVNSETGFDTDNSADVNIDTALDLDNSNEAVTTNNINVRTDTGNNQTSFNNGSGVIKFGDAEAETNEMNVANLNVTGDTWWLVVVNKYGTWNGTTIGSPEDMEVSATGNAMVLAPLGSGIKVANNETGPESNNSAGANINHTTDITNSNQADILNTIDLDAISGENEAQFNTGHGYIDTGNIRTAINVINFANANITVGNWLVTVVNVFGNWAGNLVFNANDNAYLLAQSVGQLSGDSSATNSNTGADSDNNSETNNVNNTDIANNNTSLTNTNATTSAVTGVNSASYNTGSGVVATGQADSGNSVANAINNNSVGLGETSGAGSTDCANSTTGAVSENDCLIDTANNTGVTNNNNSTADNNYAVVNSTGQNASDYNTGSGLVDTGWASAFLELYNEQNNTEVSMGEFVEEFNEAVVDEPASVDNPVGGSDISSNNNTNTNQQPVFFPQITAQSNNSQQLQDNKNIAYDNLLSGDLNGDGVVDDFDFSILMASWGLQAQGNKADTNKDGVVDDRDFSVVMANWSRSLAVLQ